jgi:steroid delta-isomerase-like uncharacterized protein
MDREMSPQTIRAYYRAFNARDYDAMLALLSDDVAHDINQGEREVGKDRFATFLRRMDAAYSEQIDELAVMADDSGRRFAAEFVVVGRYLHADPGFPPANGQSYRLPAAATFEVLDGQIRRVTTYYNLKAWLRQVGGGE